MGARARGRCRVPRRRGPVLLLAAVATLTLAVAGSASAASSPRAKNDRARSNSAAASSGGGFGGSLATAMTPLTPGASSGVVGWGLNEYAQVGDGTNTGPESCGNFPFPCSTIPVAASGLSEATEVAADTFDGVALLKNGTVVAWGNNNFGDLGDGTTTGPENCGTNRGYCSRTPVTVNGVSEAAAVAAGESYSLALLKNGTVMSWGGNYFGELGNGTTTGSDVPVAVSGLAEVSAISAGGGHGLALLKNGTVMAWGENRYGQLGNGATTNSDVPVPVSGLSEVAAIAAGSRYSLALLKNGSVMAWGENATGQLGDGTSTGPETCEAEGSKVACSRTPVAVSGLGEVSALAASGKANGGYGGGHSLALLKNGSVMSWGANGAGQLGDGNTTGSDVPVPVSGLSEATAVAAGSGHSLALLRNGTVMSWGSNGFGELGTGSTTDSDVPVAVAGLAEVTAISGGANFSLAIGVLVALPVITNVQPNNGPAAGGTSVTITGANFNGATAVKFGSVRASSFKVESETSITATSPAGTGPVDVTVTTPLGTNIARPADQFDYAPTVTQVQPGGGPLGGGTTVTITGTNFTGATAVMFGSTSAASFTTNSATSITATSPAGSGKVNVTVTTAGGTSPTSAADEFDYGPTVTNIIPSHATKAGGTSVTISGFNFTGATAVKFGETNASFTVDSSTMITAISPPEKGFTAVLPVTVTTPEGTSATSSADEFHYVSGCQEGHAPAVTGVEPHGGPAGTSVTIKGERFFTVVCQDEGFSVQRVLFGFTEATRFESPHEGEIVAVAPPGAGTVDVTVESGLGQSPANPGDKFTYGTLAPTVKKVEPNHGSPAGGTAVTISGTGFGGATAVKFGSSGAASFTVNSETSIVAVAPAGSAGAVDITVVTPGGTSVTSSADRFTYAPMVDTIVTEGLGAPTAVAVDPSSQDFWVAETAQNHLLEFSPQGKELKHFGETGSGLGQFNGIGGIAVNKLGDLYAIDTDNHRVQEFSNNGEYITQFPAGNAMAIAVDSEGTEGNVWIHNWGPLSGSELVKFSPSGTQLAQFGSIGGAPGQLSIGFGLAISNNKIYVAELGRAQEFTTSGEFLGQFDEGGWSKGTWPWDIAIDPTTGNVFIAELGTDRVQEFSGERAFLTSFGSPGSGSEQFSNPISIAVNSSGVIYVADSANGRVSEWR